MVAMTERRQYLVSALLALGCTASATPSRGPATRILLGDGDTVTVYSRLPVQLPARAVDAAGREVLLPPMGFTWLSGDSIPVSSRGAVMCHRPGSAAVGVLSGRLFARAIVRCQPVRSVRMAGPLNLLVGDSSHRFVAEVVGVDGKPVREFRGAVEILRPSVVRVEAGRVIPLAPGGTLLSLLVGDESATIAIHVYEEVATLETLRPEQDHVALPLRLRSGESVGWKLPPGTWMIAMQPNTNLPEGLRFDVEGAGCEAQSFPKGAVACRSQTGGFIRISLEPGPHGPELRTRLLLRRTKA